MLDRRGFLKFIGGAAVGTLATPVVWKGLDDISIWSQNWPWIPSLQYGNHENTYVRTVSKLCPAAGATKIRLVGGRPVRVLSDPESPLGGGVSALAVTEVQMRYSPARLKRPLLRNSDGGYREISWEEAEKLLLEKLAAAKKQTEHDSVVCISGDENGTMNELLAGFAAQTGSGRFFAMPSDAQATAQAWKLMGGRGRVGFDIPNSDYVFAVGANVLETWGSVVVNRHAWGQARPAGAEPAMRLAYAGPVQNNTAAGADLWLPIKPGTELFLLLGVARQLIKDGVAAPAGGLDDFAALVAKWTPEKVCEITGLMPERFTAVVDGLKKAKKPLVVVGSDMDQGGGTGPVRIGMAINMLLDRVNKEGGMRMIPLAPPAVNGAASYDVLMQGDLVRYAADMAQGNMPEVGVLMVYEANPVYALPGKDIEAVFKKSDFSVAFTCFFDETARRCDLVLPNALGLERYDDVAEPLQLRQVRVRAGPPGGRAALSGPPRRRRGHRHGLQARHQPRRFRRRDHAQGQSLQHRRRLGFPERRQRLRQRHCGPQQDVGLPLQSRRPRSRREGRSRRCLLRQGAGRGLREQAWPRYARNRHSALQHQAHH